MGQFISQLLQISDLASLTSGAGRLLIRASDDSAWELRTLAIADIASGTLGATRGGTGLSSYAQGDLIYASNTNTLAKLAANATSGRKYLVSYNGIVAGWDTPSAQYLSDFNNLVLKDSPNHFTGNASWTVGDAADNSYIFTIGPSLTVTDAVAGTSASYNPATGLLTAPSFSGSGASITSLNAGNLGSGTVATARLGSGTANSGVFLRGDQTWSNTLAAGTITASAPFSITQTWNNSGVAFNSFLVNVTDANSASGSMLADFQVAGLSKINIANSGLIRNVNGHRVSGGGISAGNYADFTHDNVNAKITITGAGTTGGGLSILPSTNIDTGTVTNLAATTISRTYNQASGTPGGTDLKIVRTETAVLGTHRLIDCYAGAAGTTNVFYVTNAGVCSAQDFQTPSGYQFKSLGIAYLTSASGSNVLIRPGGTAVLTASAAAGATVTVNDPTAASGATKLIVKAGAGQSTTNLEEWQDNSGNVLANIGNTGTASFSSGNYTFAASLATFLSPLNCNTVRSTSDGAGLALQARSFTNSTVGLTVCGGTYSASTAVSQTVVAITPTINQTGTATGYTALKINVTETAVLGTNRLIDAQVGGTTKFAVGNDGVPIIASKTPSSASDTGTPGQIAWDASYIYVCTGTNTWKRVAIATW